MIVEQLVVSDEGLDELLCAIVKCAVQDYGRGPTHQHERDYHSARQFLEQAGLIQHASRAIASGKVHVQRRAQAITRGGNDAETAAYTT